MKPYVTWRAALLAALAAGAFIAGLLLAGPKPRANVPCTLPVTLSNGTIADATQVMANFNALVTCLQLAAASGNNADILQLLGLTTPLSPNSGGTGIYLGGTSTGSANAQIVATTVPNSFTLTTGFRVTFIAGFNNTGATTLNVAGTGAKSLWRKLATGQGFMVGGELVMGSPVTAVYDGTEFIADGDPIMVGEIRDWPVITAPTGWLIADGSCQVSASFPVLSFVLGTGTFGSCGAGNFGLPDLRGRAIVGLDNMGTGAGAANRLTSAATGCGTAMTAIGATCANSNQSHTQIVAEIATHNHTITDPGHTHGLTPFAQNGITVGAAHNAYISDSGGTVTTNSATTGITVNNQGSSQPMPIVNPNIGLLKIIRY